MKIAQSLMIPLVLFLPGCAAAEECGPLQAGFLEQLKQENFDAAETTLSRIETGCPPKVHDNTQRQFTESIAATASRWLSEGKAADAAALIKRAKTVSWTVYSVKGDLAAKQQKWRAAAEEYLLAYELLSDPHAAPAITNLAEIRERIRRRAEEAQLVHGEIVAVATTRGAKPKMLAGEERGPAVEQDIPIQFDTDSAKLNPAGIQSADLLVADIQSRSGLNRILVVGHTDERGEVDYNQKLSERRAQAVAQYLKNHGITIPMKTEGHGESDPKEISDAKRYTQEEQWAIQRRVQINTE